MSPETFQQRLLTWFDSHGRKDLPWQHDITPYRVWLSETMLQQTQVATVISYFHRFIESFPDLEALALAPLDEVLYAWSGLGYYARARNLHKAARQIYGKGYFPDNLDELIELPGVGRSTAGAILSIAFNKSQPILDGNVKRVLCRFKAISGWPGDSKVAKELWAVSAHFTPQTRVAAYTQAIMDLGATVCTRNQPACSSCPLTAGCSARMTGTIKDFPSPKPARVLPVKQRVFLVLRDSGQRILLEKRPPAGIWGGLWSLPEFADDQSAANWCSANNLKIISRKCLATQRHSFSHYHLDYTPLFAQTDRAMNNVMEAGRIVWYKAGQINGLGLPAPVKQLILQSTNEDNND